MSQNYDPCVIEERKGKKEKTTPERTRTHTKDGHNQQVEWLYKRMKLENCIC